MKKLWLVVLLLLVSAILAEQGLEIIEETEPSVRTAGSLPQSKVIDIESFDELMSRTGQEGTSGSVVLLCGKDSKMENHCENITMAFKQFQHVYPEFKQEFIYYDLNRADFRVMAYFDIERIPHIMFIKDRRIYTYRYKSFSMNTLASFISFFELNPDAMWRHFPTKPRSKVDYFVETLFRLQDRIYLLSNGMTWAINAVYLVFIILLLVFAYGVAMFIREVFTGKVYENLPLDGGLDHNGTSGAAGSATRSQDAKETSESLKVKND